MQDLNDTTENLVGEQFVEKLLQSVATESREFLQIPRFDEQPIAPTKLKKFLLQLFLSVRAFWGSNGDPGFLGFAVANLSEATDPASEVPLEILEAKQQEYLQANPAAVEEGQALLPKLRKVLQDLGVTAEELKQVEPKEPTRNYVSEMSELYSSSEWQTSLGALVSLEQSLATELELLAGLIKNLAPENQFVLGINPYQLLEKIGFDQENKNLVTQGVVRQLEVRQEFYRRLNQYLNS